MPSNPGPVTIPARAEQVTVRFRPDELAAIQNAAGQAVLRRAAFVREAAIEAARQALEAAGK